VKKSPRTNHLPPAATRGARNHARVRLSAAAFALLAGSEFLDLNLFFGAKRGLFEPDLHVVTQIGPAPSIFCPIAAPKECFENSAAESSATENFPENLEWIMKNAAAKTCATLCERGVAKPIVGSALVRVD
jgi:hypothetical protein